MSDTQNNPFTINRFRISVFVFATVLGSLAAWILVAEVLRPKQIEFTTDAQLGGSAYAQRDAALRAARAGVVRGDLWSEAAFAYGDVLWSEKTGRRIPTSRASIRSGHSLNKLLHMPHTIPGCGFFLRPIIFGSIGSAREPRLP